MIENNDENLAEKRDSVYLECLEGKDKDGGGGGMLLCRRVMMVSSLPYAYGQVGSMILFFFFSVYRQLGSNKQADRYIKLYKILLLKILYNQNNDVNFLKSFNYVLVVIHGHTHTRIHIHAYARIRTRKCIPDEPSIYLNNTTLSRFKKK